MELREMIKVMQHFENGGEVEYREKDSDKEWGIPFPTWNWEDFEYLIKEQKQKQKVTIEKWLMQDTIDKEYRIIETSLVDSFMNFKKVKLIESYEIDL